MSIRPNKDGFFPPVIGPLEQIWIGRVALGNMTEYEICLTYLGRRLVVSIMGRGAYSFDSFVHWSYAHEYLGIGVADAKNVCDFINSQLQDLGFSIPPFKSQGEYHYPDLLRD